MERLVMACIPICIQKFIFMHLLSAFCVLFCFLGDCAEGFWCRIGARVRNPQDGESGFPCPPGHYCPEGNVLH